MKKSLLSLLLVFLVSIGLIACSSDNTTASEPAKDPEAPTEEASKEEPTAEVGQLEVVIERLLSNNLLVPLGDIPVPEDNPMIDKVIELGQILYFDPRLSGNNERSCMTCHVPELGYGDARATFEKFDGSDGPRNSPTVINSGYYTSNFWDGRAASLEEQALGPIQDPGEMNQPLDELLVKLTGIEGYPELFEAAFGDPEITAERIGKAIAAFERLVVVRDTPYDRFLQGELDALNEQEIRGLDLFAGKASCITCHQGENLSDNQFHNIGIVRDSEGRKAVTGNDADLGAIRTPGLYGLTHTAPFMSDGSIATVEEVVEYYNRGGDLHPNKSGLINPLNLSAEEQADLVAFLKALGGEVPLFAKPELPSMN
ncbi:cytochrome-c peroxidase [Anaerobacillus isosaccharinicus]|uniref:Methylamine utilization protein MauG n=1 Tax=Anaerobacillus isosaccharinicus TaxID=1532552 RepID=A0A7S7L476_9BACI|nr:cytochrome c peroxidase [Anaerobacillus isosaccharinicus]MBA5587714.1 cytochrome-c peroxidase [Anaerobacillus isosaccharinicus]QOY34120.1 cytochrome-c peroxidase [Anaerobacillus isosaccharinicus]